MGRESPTYSDVVQITRDEMIDSGKEDEDSDLFKPGMMSKHDARAGSTCTETRHVNGV